MTPRGSQEALCSIERALAVIGERWTPLVLRELHYGVCRFADIRHKLGIASNVLSDRLQTLVEAGVVERRAYQEPGSRERHAYELTRAGREAIVVLAALQQWGDDHAARPDGPSVLRRRRGTDESLRVAFVSERGSVVELEEVEMVASDSLPGPQVDRAAISAQ